MSVLCMYVTFIGNLKSGGNVKLAKKIALTPLSCPSNVASIGCNRRNVKKNCKFRQKLEAITIFHLLKMHSTLYVCMCVNMY